MTLFHFPHALVAFMILSLICMTPAAGIDAALGEIVPLQGYSSGSMYVYLFLTGPNLPVNGVQLNDVTKRADEGYFTRVTVDGNDFWSYKWNTGNVNGRLDAGTYTIWVVNGPNDRSNLANADYRTLSVTLGKPSLVVDAPAPQTGAIEVTSSPAGAAVSLDGRYRGRTPTTIIDLSPGSHTLTFTLDGYYEYSTPVPVQAGRISEVAATLVPVQVTPEPTAEPTAEPTVPPTTKASALLPACIAGGFVLLALRRMRG